MVDCYHLHLPINELERIADKMHPTAFPVMDDNQTFNFRRYLPWNTRKRTPCSRIAQLEERLRESQEEKEDLRGDFLKTIKRELALLFRVRELEKAKALLHAARAEVQGRMHELEEAVRVGTAEQERLRALVARAGVLERLLLAQIEAIPERQALTARVQLSKPTLLLPVHIMELLWVGKTEDFHCPICDDDIAKRDELQVTSCGHIFCRTCLDSWLSSHCSCPTCRGQLRQI